MSTSLRSNGTTLVGFAMLAATLLLLWHSFDPAYQTTFAAAGRGPMFFPRILLAIMLALSLLVIGQSVRQPVGSFEVRKLVPVICAAAATAVYVFLISAIGYLFATIAFSFALPCIFGYRRYLVTAAFAALYATLTWYVFEMIFRIVLPKSPWFSYF